MTFPGRQRDRPRPTTSMFALEPDLRGPFLYGRGNLPRLPWQKLYVYNRPMGFRHWRRENPPSMQGRKLSKIKVVKKFVTQTPHRHWWCRLSSVSSNDCNPAAA
ncbi:hypothetical protein MTO96_009101 [Rhipicephalus appendiculatus]